MKKQMAYHKVVPNLTSGRDEEEEEEKEEDSRLEQSNHDSYDTLFESTSTAAFFSRFIEMSRQFGEMMELHRKQHLTAEKKPERASLSFDSPPPAKSRKLKSPFTQTRSAADIIGATQADEDFERNSLALKSS